MDDLVKPGLHYAGDSEFMEKLQKIDPNFYYITVGTNLLKSIDELGPEDFFQLNFRLLGGKGGFGSLLKSFRIHKSANQLMSRDLTGRRLADVREEERLRRWISKKADRDAKKKKEKEEKLLKLKNGGKVKHQFKDKKYMRRRDLLLEQTEDAIEAGLRAEEEKSESPDSGQGSSPAEVEDKDSDIDLDDEIPLLSRNRKRKVIATEPEKIFEEKKPKVVKNESKHVVKISVEEKNQVQKPQKKEDPQVQKVEKVEKKDFPVIDLEDYSGPESLEKLGLEHLKHGLESRGLKCGGSLPERAQRLFSVKGLTPDQYPKKIRAAKK
ncbi:hypothetical protein FO519_005668 [Halicephalobus sp. NKZ332]|nr:hypothetical protein FO519_005668 [Halicephalobus sp. NKZ332]